MKPTESRSLILSDKATAVSQPLFFPDFAKSELERLESRGEFTGARLFEREPEKYRLIVTLLAEGTIAESYISQLCGVSRNTVQGVREREKIPVEHEKERILKNVRAGLRMATERLIELVPKMNARDATIAIGVLAEKMQLLSGEATAIIANAGDKAKHADFNALLASLPAADATVFEMGSSGGKEFAKGGAGSSGFDGAGDDESSALPSEKAGSNGGDNVSGGSDADLGDRSEGGRGVAEGEGVNNPN